MADVTPSARRMTYTELAQARGITTGSAEADSERIRAEELQAKLDDATVAERIARDEAAGLRAELDARQSWGLRRRLRWALSSKR